MQKQRAVDATTAQGGQLCRQCLFHGPVLPKGVGIVQGVKFDFLRA